MAPLQRAAGNAGFNGVGNHGYGAYGENVGIGNLDDDPQLEIVVTFDNHQINVFNDDGTSVLASPWYTNRESGHVGARLGWGQFIRWLSPKVENDQYHRHTGAWPDVRKTAWLQWTASPPSIADLDGDGHNEVIVFGTYGPTRRSGRLVVLSAAGKRLYDIRLRHQGTDGNGTGVPAAPSIADLDGDGRLEIVLSTFDHGIDVYRVPRSGRTACRGQPAAATCCATARARRPPERSYSTTSACAACASNASIATTSSARACVAARTTGGAQPAS